MRRGPGPTALGISLALHLVLAVPLVVFARPPEPIEFETIRLNIVSPPPTDAAEPEPQPAPPQPEPEPQPEPVPVEPEPEPEAEPEEEPEPEPEPEREQRDVEKPPDIPEEQPEPTEPADQPADTAAAGGEDLEVATEGREFPFPDYLSNVIVQVNRYFRWRPETRPVGIVYFEILPDGSVRNIRMVRPSGNLRFDFAVQGAVETAGDRGAFGALPEAYAGSFLPVQMEIEPPR